MAEAQAEQVTRGLVVGQIRGRTRTVLTSLPLTSIQPNPEQPRRHFDPEALGELAASIAQRGVLQPVIVKREGDRYLLMAGERRYRAAHLAGLRSIPALLRDDDPMEIAIIENLQREDLTPLEEAEGLGALADRYGYTHETLAELIGKSRPYVSNTLTLRRLPDWIKSEVHAQPDVSREILISVARAETAERQEMLWRLTRMRKLSVQRFRSEHAGEPGAHQEIVDLARIVRRLNRKLRQLDTATLPADQSRHLERLLQRANARVLRTLARVAAPRPAGA